MRRMSSSRNPNIPSSSSPCWSACVASNCGNTFLDLCCVWIVENFCCGWEQPCLRCRSNARTGHSIGSVVPVPHHFPPTINTNHSGASFSILVVGPRSAVLKCHGGATILNPYSYSRMTVCGQRNADVDNFENTHFKLPSFAMLRSDICAQIMFVSLWSQWVVTLNWLRKWMLNNQTAFVCFTSRHFFFQLKNIHLVWYFMHNQKCIAFHSSWKCNILFILILFNLKEYVSNWHITILIDCLICT